MVGEQAQEMQLASWISTTPIRCLEGAIPSWMGLWFAIFPTYESMAAQFLAALLVVGSYYAARRIGAVPLAGSDSVEEAKRAGFAAPGVKPLEVVR
jgi:high-affinity iron transporter